MEGALAAVRGREDLVEASLTDRAMAASAIRAAAASTAARSRGTETVDEREERSAAEGDSDRESTEQ